MTLGGDLPVPLHISLKGILKICCKIWIWTSQSHLAPLIIPLSFDLSFIFFSLDQFISSFRQIPEGFRNLYCIVGTKISLLYKRDFTLDLHYLRHFRRIFWSDTCDIANQMQPWKRNGPEASRNSPHSHLLIKCFLLSIHVVNYIRKTSLHSEF